MTLADKDTKSIPTNTANMAFQGNVAMQVTQPLEPMQVTSPDDQILTNLENIGEGTAHPGYWLFNFTSPVGAIWWPNLQLMQMAAAGGQFCN